MEPARQYSFRWMMQNRLLSSGHILPSRSVPPNTRVVMCSMTRKGHSRLQVLDGVLGKQTKVSEAAKAMG